MSGALFRCWPWENERCFVPGWPWGYERCFVPGWPWGYERRFVPVLAVGI
ncbi:TPA: hypothetical protein I8368_004351 [Citrobacter freundii]|nr:hypothetical protein [Citrobacter freundii]